MPEENKTPLPSHMQKLVDGGVLKNPDTPANPPADPPADPPANPPKQDDPPADPPKPADPPATPPSSPSQSEPKTPDNFDELYSGRLQKDLSSKFGEEITSIDDLHSNYSESQKKLDELRKQNEVLKLKAERELEFADPVIGEFNSFAKETGITNMTVFNKIKNVDAEKAKSNPLEILVTEQILENPDYADKEDFFRKQVLKKYGFESAEDFHSNENEEITMQMQIDANRAFKKIAEKKEKIKAPEAVDYEKQLEERNKTIADNQEKLRGVVTKMSDGLKKYKYKPAEGTDFEFDFEFDDETVGEMQKAIVDLQSKSDKPFDQDSFQKTVAGVYSNAVMRNLPKIMDAYAKSVREMTDETYRKTYTNPSATQPKEGDPRQTSGGTMSASDQAMAWSRKRFQDN